MIRTLRSHLPLRFHALESRIAPAILTHRDRHYTDSEILVKLTNPDPLFALTGRVVADRLAGMIDITGSELLYRRAEEMSGVVKATLRPGVDPEAAVAALQGRPGIAFAEVNRVVLGDSREWVPNDPRYASPGQWHLGKMQVDKAWDVTKGTSNIVVAVLDDGLPTTYEHEDLTTNRWHNPFEIDGDELDQDGNGKLDDVYGWDFVSGDANPSPIGAATHGTQVAGIIAATSNNKLGVAGVAGGDNGANGVRLMSVRIYGGALTVANLSAGLHYAVDNGAKIVNISYNVDAFASGMTFNDALNHAYTDKKSLVFVSAGNNNTGTANRSKLTQVLFVANTKHDDSRFDEPSYGSNYGTWVDLSAPGTGIVTTSTGNGGGKANTADYQSATATSTLNTGTSFAAPNAAAVAALIWSKYPILTREQVAAKLLNTTDSIDTANPQQVGLLGTGRVNAYRAVTESLPAPTFGTITGLPADGGITSSVKSISITAPWRFDPATVKQSSFELRSDGPDNTFGTIDDSTVGFTVDTYQMGSNDITLNVLGSLTSDKYRFTAKSGVFGLRSPFGVALDGNGDGTGGDAMVREFQFSDVTKVGGEFRVNQETNAWQNRPSLAVQPGGGWVTVWSSNLQDGSGFGIYGRIYDRNGTATTNEFRVNQYTTINQELPKVATDKSGNYVVVWQSDGQDGSGSGIYGRLYSVTGDPRGDEFRVNTTTLSLQEQPVVAMEPDGDFVVAWTSYLSPGIDRDVLFQRFTNTGAKLGVELPVHASTIGIQEQPAVAIDDDGDVVVIWRDQTTSGGASPSVNGQRFDSSGGKAGSQFQVNTITTGSHVFPSVAMDGAGNFTVAWALQGPAPLGSVVGLYMRQYSSAIGIVPLLETRMVAGNVSSPSIAMNGNGDGVLVWDDGNSDIFSQRLNSAGEAVGTTIQVNTFTIAVQELPAIALDDNGDFTVAWDSVQDGSGYGIYAQRFRHSTNVASLRPTNDTNLIDAGERMIQPLTKAGLTIAFSGAVNVSSPGYAGSATNPANYKLTVDGKAVVIDPQATVITASKDPNDNTSTIVTVPLPVDITTGHVLLTVEDNIEDTQSNKLDGDGDDGFGGDFVREWDVVSIGKVGLETRVNTATGSAQVEGKIAVASDGSYIITWFAENQEGSSNGIFAQRFAPNGAKVDGEFQVNTYTTGNQNSPAVGIGENGHFVIAWRDDARDGSSPGVFAQRFAPDGTKIGSDFGVPTYTNHWQHEPSIGVAADGSFAIAWSSVGGDFHGDGVMVQLFASNGTKMNSEFAANSHTTGNQSGASVAMNPNGEFVVAWSSLSQELSGWGIYAQRFDGKGQKQGGEIAVNTFTTGDQLDPTVSLDAKGNFVVSWHSQGVDGSDYGISAQRFDSYGAKVGDEIVANSYTTGKQYQGRVAVDADGDFAIIWRDTLRDGSNSGIYSRRFNAMGTAIGNEIIVNTYTTANQVYPFVGTGANGDFVVVWSSFAQDGSNYGIYAQRFGANTAPTTSGLDPLTILEGSQQNFVTLGSKFADAEDGANSLTYAVAGNSNPTMLKTVISNGVLQIETQGDFNGPATLTISATDSAGLFVESPLAVTVTPVNDAPSFVKGPDITVSVNYSLQIYSGWATSLSAGPTDEWQGNGPSQQLSFEIVGNTNPGLFTTLEVLPDGTLQYEPTPELLGTSVIQVRVRDDGGTVNGGVDVSPVQMVVLTVAPDFIFGHVLGQSTANAYTTLSQSNPAIAVDADGDTVVVWQSAGEDGSGLGVFGQRYSNQGKAVGPAFPVNTTTTGDQYGPAVAVDTAGNSVAVVWQGNGPGNVFGIYSQRYSVTIDPGTGASILTAVGAESLVTQAIASAWRVVMDSTGNHTVVWMGSGIFSRKFLTNGTPASGETAHHIGITTGPGFSAAMSHDGAFVAVWDQFVGSNGRNTRGLFVDPSGNSGGVFDINDNTAGDQSNSAVAIDFNHNFVVAWDEPDGDGTGVYMRRFSQYGIAQSGDVLVNATTTGGQGNPAISMDADGDYAIAWTGYGTDDKNGGVFVRRFLSDGTPVTAKGQLVNGITTGARRFTAIAMDHDGEFVVAWAGETGTLSNSLVYTKVDDDGIAMQRFGYPLPPTQTKAIEDLELIEDPTGASVIALFDYFSSATGKSEAMDYTVFGMSNPGLFASAPSIMAGTGKLSVTIATGKSGESTITVRVRDTTEVPTLTTFTVRVAARNDAPQLVTIPNQSVNEGSLISFTAVGSDSKDDVDPLNKLGTLDNALEYSLSGPTFGATIDKSNGKFTWAPDDGPDSKTFVIRVTDTGRDGDGKGGSVSHPLFVEQSVTITVSNIVPIATGVSNSGPVQANTPVTVTLLGATDAPGDLSTLTYAFDWDNNGSYEEFNLISPAKSHTFTAQGNYPVNVRVIDKDGGSSSLQTIVTVTAPAQQPPHVLAADVNGGGKQRSRVTSFVVSFDTAVTFTSPASDAFVLSGPSGVLIPNVAIDGTGKIATLTWSGTGTTGGSLNDGNYTLTVLASGVSTGGVYLENDRVENFHRLFGDSDGDRDVDNTDFVAFRLTFGTGNSIFNADGDGDTDNADFVAFRSRFGTMLP